METFLIVYLSISLVVYGILCIAWVRDNIFNAMIKALMGTLWIMSVILLLYTLGFIVKG